MVDYDKQHRANGSKFRAPMINYSDSPATKPCMRRLRRFWKHRQRVPHIRDRPVFVQQTFLKLRTQIPAQGYPWLISWLIRISFDVKRSGVQQRIWRYHLRVERYLCHRPDARSRASWPVLNTSEVLTRKVHVPVLLIIFQFDSGFRFQQCSWRPQPLRGFLSYRSALNSWKTNDLRYAGVQPDGRSDAVREVTVKLFLVKWHSLSNHCWVYCRRSGARPPRTRHDGCCCKDSITTDHIFFMKGCLNTMQKLGRYEFAGHGHSWN